MTLLNKILAVIMSIVAALTGLFVPEQVQPRMSEGYSAGAFSGVAGDSLVFESEAPLSGVNSLALGEDGNCVTGFTLEAAVGGEYVLLTKGDTVGEYRFCAFDAVTAQKFRLTVTACEGSFSLTDITIGNTSGNNPDFKVVSYFVANNSNGILDEGNVRASTDMIVFGIACFDENGIITLQKEDKLAGYIATMRSINPGIKVHLNILGPSVADPDWYAAQEKALPLYKNAMVNCRSDFIAGILSLLDKYGFDGVYFDWEYPLSKKARLVFSSFVVALDKALGERELGAALVDWCCKLTPAAIRAIDNVAVMAYDAFDTFGYHASFTSTYASINEFVKNGYSRNQLYLGLAFYARPTDGTAFWPGYSEYAAALGKYDNICKANCGGKELDCYFNCPQLIRDKTAYAYRSDLGGVMIWHFACDVSYSSELSLYRAIDMAKN